MKYYKYIFDEDTGGNNEIFYHETKDGWTIRQIIVDGKNWITSNVNLVLADQQIDYDSEPDITPISKQEFDEIWYSCLAPRQAIWGKVKQAYLVGTPVQGFIKIFYPQGVIVNLGGDALGVANYAACKASTKPEFMYSKHKVTAVVQGYDEVNQWIILASPQVYEEQAT
jgi:hypothetical protein